MRARLDSVQEARRQMFEAMRADPFDAAALNAAYADLRAKTNDLQEAGQAIVTDAIAKATPEVRSRIRPPRGPFPVVATASGRPCARRAGARLRGAW